MDDHQRLLDERHTAVMAAIAGLALRLDILNGKTRASELAIAGIAVFEDGSTGAFTRCPPALTEGTYIDACLAVKTRYAKGF